MIQTQSSTSEQMAAGIFPLEIFPLRAAGLAIDPRKMLLGGLAMFSLVVGDWLFDRLPFAQDTIEIHMSDSGGGLPGQALSHAGFLPRREVGSWLSWDYAAFSLLTPVRSVVAPGRVIFQMPGSWSETAFAWTQLLWALIVWSLFGGALCRMNAIQFAARRRIGIGAALKFSGRQFLAYLVALLLPLSAIVLLLGFNWLLGALASVIPSVGDLLLGIAWGLVLFTGFLMAMMLVGIAAGWPLMIAAVSTEDSDGFDGLSRAFGYLFDRPWHAALLAITSFPVFAVSRVLVGLLIGLTVTLGMLAAEGGVGDLPAREPGLSFFRVMEQGLSPGGRIATTVQDSLLFGKSLDFQGDLPSRSMAYWLCIPGLLLTGFGPSFFWAASTVIYFRLRRSDDGTPLDSVTDWEYVAATTQPDTTADTLAPDTEGQPDGDPGEHPAAEPPGSDSSESRD